MTDITIRLRAARNTYADSPELGHILHDAEEEIFRLRMQHYKCPDCGGRGAQTENGVYYCNCEEAA